MSLEKTLQQRSASSCELCSTTQNLAVFAVSRKTQELAEKFALLCQNCREQIEDPEKIEAHHWRCLNESMWSQVPAVQVLAWRMLKRLSTKAEIWAQDLLDMLYLDDETLAWAQENTDSLSPSPDIVHKDSNGVVLQAGDTVTLIKDLNVKGANFTAKRGTAVRKISLVADNPEHIEGRVEGQQIIILTQFVKKSS